MDDKMIDVVTVGAVLVDQLGSAERLPKEDEEVFITELITRPGGSAANTAVGCTRFYLRTGFIGTIGNDYFGRFLLDDFEEEGVDTSQVKIVEDKPTGTCIIMTNNQGRRHMYAHSGAANYLSEHDIDEAESYINASEIVHLADLKNIEPLLRAAELSSGPRVSLNPGGLIIGLGYERVRSLLSRVNIYISSKKEAETLYDTKDDAELLGRLFDEGIDTIALTMGSEGCLVADRSSQIYIPPYKVDVVDATGAGDAFSAGFIHGILNGYPLEKAGRYANATAALCVTTECARFQHSIEEVEELIKTQYMFFGETSH